MLEGSSDPTRKSISPARNKVVFFVLKVVVAGLMMTVLVQKISVAKLSDAIRSADNVWIVMAAVLMPLNLYLQFFKWRLLVHRENLLVKKRHILYSLLVGMALGLVTPGRVGDFGRTFFIKRADWAKLLGLLMIDKLITLAILYIIGIFGLSHFISMRLHPFVWLPVFIMTLGLVLMFLVFLLRPEILRSIIARYHHFLHRYTAIDRFMSGIEMATPSLTLKLFLMSALQTLTYCTQFVLLIFAFAKMALLQAYLTIFAVMFTKSLLPISIGDLGIRESASIYFFGYFGISDAAAFNASFLLFTMNVLVPSILGFLLFLLKRQTTLKWNGRS